MNDDLGLTVRRFERTQMRRSVRLRIERTSAGQVKPSSESGVAGFVAADVVDLSEGGVGLESRFFLPRRCSLILELQDGPKSGVLEIPLRVQRVKMSDRRPTYLIGTSYTATEDIPSADLKKRIRELQQKLTEVKKGGPTHATRP